MDENKSPEGAPLQIKDWEGFYKETPTRELPWYTETADPEVIEAAKKYSPPPAKLLDLGTGPATMAIEYSRLGYSVTATDISPTAIATAKERAAEAGVDIEFSVDDVRDSALTGHFDLANDRGCFHTLRDGEPEKYVQTLASLLKDGGLLLLKTFSEKEPGEDGPVRYSLSEVTALFDKDFELIHSEEGTFKSTLDHNPKARFYILKKTKGR